MGDIADDLIQDGIDTMIEDGASFEQICNVLEGKTNQGGSKMKRQFFIAGVQFRPRHEINAAVREMKVGDLLVLAPEPDNKFDPNAVKILAGDGTGNGAFLGYVPKKFSSEVSAMLGIGAPIICTVDEVNPDGKTYEMIKVTVAIPVDEEESEDYMGTDDELEGGR